jgi:hypothetical protein
VLGESDKDGMYVKDTPVQVPDLLATIYKKLGIDYEREYKSNIGRPIDFLMSRGALRFSLRAGSLQSAVAPCDRAAHRPYY